MSMMFSASIVRIRAYDNNKVVAEGSGFVVNEKGYVLTNAHLLEKAEELTASPPEDQGRGRGAASVLPTAP